MKLSIVENSHLGTFDKHIFSHSINYLLIHRDEDGIQIVALGVTSDVNRKELTGVSGMNKVTKIDVFDDFHELASILLQASTTF